METAKKITIIPARSRRELLTNQSSAIERVAAYCRVSTDSEEQDSSFEYQQEHFEKLLSSHPSWESAGIYADDGISGKSVKNRKEFQRMIKDAHLGKIDKIVTKSISRFARNGMECKKYVLELKEMGISVFFEKESLDSLTSGSDLILSILASVAEQESRDISTNIIWTYKNKFKEGKVYLNTVRFLGFTKDENKKIIIVPEEAEIVKRIYLEFVGGKTYNEIARGLTADNIKSPGDIENKGKSWHSSTIFSILQNEKYMGDAILQKTFSVDFLSKRQKNQGQVDSVEVKDCLPCIIPKELWNMAQLEIEKRKGVRNISAKNGNGKYSSKYAFSGKIVCGCCNSKFRRHAQWSVCNGNRIKTPVWVCQNKQMSKNSNCQNLPIKEVVLEQAFVEEMRRLFNEKDYFTKTLEDNISYTITKDDGVEVQELQSEIDKNSKLMLKLNEDLSNGIIEQAEYLTQFDELAKIIDSLILRQKAIKSQETEQQAISTRMSEMAEFLHTATSFEIFDSTIFMNVVENIKVISKHRIVITFKCGFEYEMEI